MTILTYLLTLSNALYMIYLAPRYHAQIFLQLQPSLASDPLRHSTTQNLEENPTIIKQYTVLKIRGNFGGSVM